MKQLLQIVLLMIIIPAVFEFVALVVFAIIPTGGHNWIRFTVAILTAIGVGYLVHKALTGNIAGGLIASILIGATILGSIGLMGGMILAGILYPTNEQGFLLGLFVTGPAGFVAGAVMGGVTWYLKTH